VPCRKSLFCSSRLKLGDSVLVKMQITHKTEITIERWKRVVVRLPETVGKILCPNCADGAMMISAEQATALFGINRQAIYLMIETETTVHLVANKAGVVFVCLNSLAEILNDANRESIFQIS
jgi:hypothetical protein